MVDSGERFSSTITMAPINPSLRRRSPRRTPRVKTPKTFKKAVEAVAGEQARRRLTQSRSGVSYGPIACKALEELKIPVISDRAMKFLGGGEEPNPTSSDVSRNQQNPQRNLEVAVGAGGDDHEASRCDPAVLDAGKELKKSTGADGAVTNEVSGAGPGEAIILEAEDPEEVHSLPQDLPPLAPKELNGGHVLNRVPPPPSSPCPPPPPPSSPSPLSSSSGYYDPLSGVLTVWSADDVHTAIAAMFSGDTIHIRIPFELPLGKTLDVANALNQSFAVQRLVQDTALLSAKISQARWLRDELRLARDRVEQLEMMQLAPWLPTQKDTGALGMSYFICL